MRPDWGHCTVDYAVLVAQKVGTRRLCLFHHDPRRSDDELDQLVARARRDRAATTVTDVAAAAEGRTLTL